MKKLGYAIAVLVLLSGCGTIINGTTQVVEIYSTPSGATVYSSGSYLGETPCAVPLSRNRIHILQFKKPGFETVVKRLESNFSLIVLLNIFWFDFITPTVIDLISGGAWWVAPESVHVKLTPKGPVTSEGVK